MRSMSLSGISWRCAGLSEETLREMEPDERVTALEQAHLDPYDYIYLAC